MHRRQFLKSAVLASAQSAVIRPADSLGREVPTEAPYTNVTDDNLQLGNSFLELVFDPKANGALSKVVEKHSGYEFLRDRQAPRTLFRLAIRNKSDRQLVWFDSRDGSNFHATRNVQAGNAILAFEVGGFPNQRFSVRVEVALTTDSPL